MAWVDGEFKTPALMATGLATLAAFVLSACSNPVTPLTSQATDARGLGAIDVNEVGVTEEGGRILGMSGQSTALMSLWTAEGAFEPSRRCGAGRRYRIEWESPIVGVPQEPKVADEMWPVGTTFKALVRCEGPLPNEIDGFTGENDERFAPLVAVDTERFLAGRAFAHVQPIHYWPDAHGVDGRLKYEAFSEFVGENTRDAFIKCGGPVVVRSLVAANRATEDGAPVDEQRGEILAGIALECLENEPGTP